MLANRLKLIFHKCIFEEQPTFISRRSILDIILVGTKLIHYMNSKTRGNSSDISMKVDMSKANDQVDWRYLKAITGKMDFVAR